MLFYILSHFDSCAKMLILNIFKTMLTLYVILYNCIHLQAQYSIDDDYESDTDNTVYYHIQEATWATTAASEKPLISTTSISTSKSHGYNTTIGTTEKSTSSTPRTTNTIEERPHETEEKDYLNYSVLSITLPSLAHMKKIIIFEARNLEYIFLSHRRVSNSPILIAFPSNETKLRTFLKQQKIDYRTVVLNLGKTKPQNMIPQIPPSFTAISFRMYLKYDFVMGYLKYLSIKYPEIASLIKIGKTIEGRDITILKIKSLNPREKFIEGVFIQAGMHGNEWLGVSAALYVIHELVEHAAANKDMFEGFLWYILPILNADGYEYSHTTDSFWKYNRRLYKNCNGVNLNRNFEIGDNETLQSDKQCYNLHSGETPGSEPETQALQRFLQNTKTIITVYISLHSGEPFIGYPWAYTSQQIADYQEIRELATRMKDTLEAVDNSTVYRVDRLYSLCGKYNGDAIDWAKREGIVYPLMISLKGGLFSGINVPTDEIFQNVVATFKGIREMRKHIHTPQDISIRIQQRRGFFPRNSSNTLRHFFLFIIIIWLFLNFLV